MAVNFFSSIVSYVRESFSGYINNLENRYLSQSAINQKVDIARQTFEGGIRKLEDGIKNRLDKIQDLEFSKPEDFIVFKRLLLHVFVTTRDDPRLFHGLFSEDEICPITKRIIVEPVRLPTNEVVEGAVIRAWLKFCNRNPFHPKEFLGVTRLVVDENIKNKIMLKLFLHLQRLSEYKYFSKIYGPFSLQDSMDLLDKVLEQNLKNPEVFKKNFQNESRELTSSSFIHIIESLVEKISSGSASSKFFFDVLLDINFFYEQKHLGS